MEDNKLIIYKNNEGNIIVDAIYKDEYVNSIDKSYKNSTYEMIKRK